jgi:hypothetical protein
VQQLNGYLDILAELANNSNVYFGKDAPGQIKKLAERAENQKKDLENGIFRSENTDSIIQKNYEIDTDMKDLVSLLRGQGEWKCFKTSRLKLVRN